MTEPSEVDPAVLAGEPGGAAQLEGGDDDLPPLRPEADERSAAEGPEGRSAAPDEPPPV